MNQATHSHSPFTAHVFHFARTHDEHTWFRIILFGTTVFASIALNLGVFAELVVLHMVLDVVKYRTRYKYSWYQTAIETLRESLMEVFLLSLGLFTALAFHNTFAVGGLGRLAQIEATLANVFLRILPRFQIAEHLIEVVMHWQHFIHAEVHPRTNLTRGETALCIATALFIIAFFASPLLSFVEWETVTYTLRHEMIPRLEWTH